MLADELSCGLTFVERNENMGSDYVMYFTKDNASRSRRQVPKTIGSVLEDTSLMQPTI